MKKLLFILLAVMLLVICMGGVAFASDGTEAAADTGPSAGALFNMISVIIMLAILIESIAEMIKAAINPAKWPKWVWLIITSAFGVAVCIIWGINLFAAIGLAGAGAAIVVGQIITGIVIGAGSGFVHTLLDKMLSTKNFNNSVQAIENIVEVKKAPPDGN